MLRLSQEFKGYQELKALLSEILTETVKGTMERFICNEEEEEELQLLAVRIGMVMPIEIINDVSIEFIIKKNRQIWDLLNSEEYLTPDLFSEYLIYCYLCDTQMEVEFLEEEDDLFVSEDKILKLRELLAPYIEDEILEEPNKEDLDRLIGAFVKGVTVTSNILDNDNNSSIESLLFWDYDCLLFEKLGVDKLKANKELLERLGYNSKNIGV